MTSSTRVALPTHPVLSPSAQRLMVARAQSGDQHAREMVVKHNTRLAAKIAHRFHSIDPEDAFQIASLGLLKALDTYDASRGLPFSTYAATCMKYELAHELTRLLAQRRGGGVHAVPLDKPMGGDDGTPFTLVDTLGAPDRAMEAVVAGDEARWALARVSGRHKEVVERLYGLNGRVEQTVTETGVSMGVSKQRVDQLHQAALERIRGNPTPERSRDRQRHKRSDVRGFLSDLAQVDQFNGDLPRLCQEAGVEPPTWDEGAKRYVVAWQF